MNLICMHVYERVPVMRNVRVKTITVCLNAMFIYVRVCTLLFDQNKSIIQQIYSEI